MTNVDITVSMLYIFNQKMTNNKYFYTEINIKLQLTTDAKTCPIEPAATRYPNALDRSSTGTLCANR